MDKLGRPRARLCDAGVQLPHFMQDYFLLLMAVSNPGNKPGQGVGRLNLTTG